MGIISKIILRISLLLLLTSTAVFVFAQNSPSPYNQEEILINSTYDSDAHDCFYFFIIKHPKNGSASVKQNGSGHKYFEYTPDSNYIGKDTISIEVHYTVGQHSNIKWFHYAFEVKESIVYVKDIEFSLPMNSDFTHLDVMSNDSSTLGNLEFKHISLVSKGEVDLINDSLFFKPSTDYHGVAYVTYTVCDSIDECGTATAAINVLDTANIALNDEIHLNTIKNRSIRVMLPDDGFELIDSAQLGVVNPLGSTGLWEYKPIQNLTGVDSFTFEKDGEYYRTVFVTIHDLPNPNTFLFDDYVFTPLEEEVQFNVRDNDIKKNAYISAYSSPNNGTLNYLGNGIFKFTPDSNFIGSTTFSYTGCIAGNCETAWVYIYVGNLNPQNEETYELTTTINRALVINYDVPISNFSFNITQNPSIGELEVHPGIDTIQIGCNEVIGNNLVVYTPDLDEVGWDEFELEYCINGQSDCHIVKVDINIIDLVINVNCPCVDDCVWPGDINYDGVVDMRDVLSLGWHMGSVGVEREEVNLDTWYGQTGEDWSDEQTSGANLKHVDTDGDGVIHVDDTLSISKFYNQVHTLLVDQKLDAKPYSVSLVESTSGPYLAGDLVVYDVVVGAENSPVVDLHGLSLTYSFNNTPYDFSDLDANEVNNSWLTYDGPSVFLSKSFDDYVDFAVTRADGWGAAGFGIVAEVKFVIEDDFDGIRIVDQGPTTDKVEVTLDNMVAFFANGKEFQLPKTTAVFEIQRPGHEDFKDVFDESLLRVFPNPANSTHGVNVHMNGGYSIEKIEVFDMNGKILKTNQHVNGNRGFFNLNEASSGLYIIRVTTDGGVITNKLHWVSR